MTVLVQDIQAVLDGLAAGGAWYLVNTKEPPAYPYIVWQRVASSPNVALDGISALQNTRIQIDIYGRTVQEALTVEVALEAAMAAAAFTNLPILSQDFWENDPLSYRVSRDYSVWATN